MSEYCSEPSSGDALRELAEKEKKRAITFGIAGLVGAIFVAVMIWLKRK